MLNKARATIRPVESADIVHILRYWREATDSDLLRKGETARPDEASNAKFLNWFVTARPSLEEAKEDILIWVLDGAAIGYCTLKDFQPSREAQMHLHMWEKDLRGQGWGAIFFCLCVLEFQRKHALTRIICQPNSANPMPVRVLKRIGFVQNGTKFEVSLATAKTYLASL